MDPQQPAPTPEPYPTSPFYSGPEQPASDMNPNSPGNSPPRKSKLLRMLVIGSVLELLVIISLIVVMASGGSKTPAAPPDNQAGNSQSQASDVATPTNIQVINDSISEDLSTLNDEQDFATIKYEDKTLGL